MFPSKQLWCSDSVRRGRVLSRPHPRRGRAALPAPGVLGRAGPPGPVFGARTRARAPASGASCLHEPSADAWRSASLAVHGSVLSLASSASSTYSSVSALEPLRRGAGWEPLEVRAPGGPFWPHCQSLSSSATRRVPWSWVLCQGGRVGSPGTRAPRGMQRRQLRPGQAFLRLVETRSVFRPAPSRPPG